MFLTTTLIKNQNQKEQDVRMKESSVWLLRDQHEDFRSFEDFAAHVNFIEGDIKVSQLESMDKKENQRLK